MKPFVLIGLAVQASLVLANASGGGSTAGGTQNALNSTRKESTPGTDTIMEQSPTLAPASATGDLALGLVIAIVSTVTASLGYNLQRKSFKNYEALKEQHQGSALALKSAESSMLWRAGFLTFALGSIGTFVAFNFAPQSLVAPLGGFGLVSNAVFARYLCGETFHKSDALGTALIIAGSFVIIWFSKASETRYTTSELLKLYARPGAIAFLSSLFALTVAIFVFIRYLESKKHVFATVSTATALRSMTWSTTETVRSADSGHLLLEIRRDESSHCGRPLAYSLLPAIFSTLTTLFAKSFAEILSTSLSGNPQWTTFGFYFFLLLTAAAACLHIRYLNLGLSQYDALLVIPFMHGLWTIFSVISGGIIFDEFSKFAPWEYVWFSIGVLVATAGAFILTARIKRPKKQMSRT